MYPIDVGFVEECHVGEPIFTGAGFVLQQVIFRGTTAHQFPRAGHPKALGSRSAGLEFRHS